MSRILFRGAILDDRRCDLRVDGDRIVDRVNRDDGSLEALAGEEVVDGGLLTPPFAEPHVHLDAALLGEKAPNVSGTLSEGIANWTKLRDVLTADDIRERATRTALMYAEHGTLRIRTHVDTGNLLAVETILGLKDDFAARGIELSVVAFPQEGILRAAGQKAAWTEAVRLGCDAVGAVPHLEDTVERGFESVRLAFALASEFDRAVDLHCDESDEPACRNLAVVCEEAMTHGFAGRVVAGHCTAMASYPDGYAAEVIEQVVAAGVQVVTNPLDNIVLQGRSDGYPKRRGLTRVDEVWAAGALVGIGHDSVQDPWYRLGTADMLDPAYMLVHAGHLTSEADMRRVFRTLHHENHLPFGGPPSLTPGARARFLHWEHEDPIAILRDRPRPRVVNP